MKRLRLDRLLVQRALAEDLEQARALIESGILVGGMPCDNAKRMVGADVDIRLPENAATYVSRGAQKLLEAVCAFDLSVEGITAMDVGASTGGFTDVLLQHGAKRVYAVDVGYGQLAWKLRQDPRVVVLERENIRTLAADKVPEPIDLSVIDASFISLTKILLPVARLMKAPGSPIVALIKPQFEARREQVGKGGVVRDEDARQECIDKVRTWAKERGFVLGDVIPSPIRGPAGNIEYLLFLRTPETIEVDENEDSP